MSSGYKGNFSALVGPLFGLIELSHSSSTLKKTQPMVFVSAMGEEAILIWLLTGFARLTLPKPLLLPNTAPSMESVTTSLIPPGALLAASTKCDCGLGFLRDFSDPSRDLLLGSSERSFTNPIWQLISRWKKRSACWSASEGGLQSNRRLWSQCPLSPPHFPSPVRHFVINFEIKI